MFTPSYIYLFFLPLLVTFLTASHVKVRFKISWDPGYSDDEIELKIKRDLPRS